MESLDMTILNTAVPTIAGALGVAPLSLKSALTSYTLSLALFIPLSGWIADRFGTRRVFSTAIGIFALGSLLCGLSTNVHFLVAARILQGIGGAMMMPVGRIAIVRTFAKSEIIRAMSFVVIPGLIGPLLGPVTGGLIVGYLPWRVIFFINVPIGLISLFFVYRYMPDYKAERSTRLDFTGFVLFGLGVALLSHVLEVFGEHEMGLTDVLAMLGISLALLLLYARHSLRTPHPLLRLELFRKRTFGTAVSGSFLSRIGMGGMPFLLPVYYQVCLGYSPVHAALLIMPQPVAAMALKMVVPHILKYFGYRRILVYNTIALGVLIAFFATVTAATPVWVILIQAFCFGFLMSLHYTSINSLTFADLDPAETSMGSSMSSVAQQLSMSFGVATASLLTAMFLGFDHGSVGSSVMSTAIRSSFITLGIFTLATSLLFRRLHPTDGDNVSRGSSQPAPLEEAARA
ncbi:MAG TPA: DHA2 family efflux MFS transporter permease subunit [Rariglobus sp.]|nr:DHA2 family efflux MFS transporter permease subunit [Rariglobus sp.]